jgi:hypothetical protein
MTVSPKTPHARTRVLCLLFLLISAAGARATESEINLPVRLDNTYLREAVITQVFRGDRESAQVWDDGTGCNFMVISDPAVVTQAAGDDQGIIVRFASDARIGQRVGERCVVVLDWSGFITTEQTVELEPGSSILRFRIVDSHIEDREVRHGIRVGTLWDWVKQYVHPRLNAVRVDLAPALGDLKSVLQLVLPDGRGESLSSTLESISMESVAVSNDGLIARLNMRVPENFYESSPAAPTLSAAELARFEAAWQGWDSFITFVVKHFAAGGAAPEVRRELLDVLIQARYDLLDILASDTGRNTAVDPVRTLFVETWSRLAPVLRRLSARAPGERALNLLSFITAADALQTLDALGPRFNLEISVDGLRRMARILVPQSESDPLIYDQRVDPELRQLFDFGPPPRLREDEDTAPEPQSWWRGLVPAAHAAAPLGDKQISRLNHWIPSRAEIDAYLSMVHRLLNQTGRNVAAESKLDPELHELFRVLVLATAWQETCWRQYRRAGEEVVPIRSPAGAVGMMQVVPTVWRGFYEPQGLTRDIAYNAEAGSEILMHYLQHYAIERGEHKQPGGRDNLAWATYAAYNGGPRQFRRYRAADTRESLRDIDTAFRDKFKAIREGDELAVRSCYVD